MTRIEVLYGGQLFSITGRDLEDVQAEVIRGVEKSGWLKVRDGGGPAWLALSPGTPVALVPLDELDAD